MTGPSEPDPAERSLTFQVALSAVMVLLAVLAWRFVAAAGPFARVALVVWIAAWVAAPFLVRKRPASSRDGAASSRDGALLSRESAEAVWERAVTQHDAVLLAYLPFETDPEAVLEHPALTDVTQEPTQRFFEALGRAQALRTESFPHDAALAGDYVTASDDLTVAWERARRHAMRVGRGYLDDQDARLVEQAARLLRQAAGATTPAERAAYAERARRLLDTLVASGAIVLPPRVVAAVETQARRAIEERDDES